MIPKNKHARERHKMSPGATAIKHHPDYQIWNGMLGRCMNPRDMHFHNYGAKGISVCDRWMSFWAFVEDMGARPSIQHSIDRIDNTKGYEPGNCRWATKREQTINRSITRLIEFQGVKKCLTDWACDLGISVNGLRDRIESGWSIERALTTPVNLSKRNKRSHA